ncbi:Oidioi.mRNA.OKI2018_I69.PAR.g8680.t1.cds [Oikopleura dioica]|uniref:Metalloendopeptidase n=1 Tax=Oikopleura dioica TaxID=34765 RepID=A0ABN7RLE4_OIKDI|nr:Oidioi.mRNA.OKI2018_I69.PAR.g8680.t1.cds [Oikopleura dioica]
MPTATIHPEALGETSSLIRPRGARTNQRWPGNTYGVEDRPYLLIPYRFRNGAHTSIADAQRIIAESLDLITADVGGCIRFVDDSEAQAHSHWIDFQDDENDGCKSYIGYHGDDPSFPNGQRINLASGCLRSDVVNHEVLHALGFDHEHERPDRDDHSIMHYDAFSFQTIEAAVDELPTITNLDGDPVQWPEVERLSSTDVFQLAKMYEGFCGQPGEEFIKVRSCNSGAEYLESRLCDGIKDCADGSDEELAFCDEYCEPETFYVSENGCYKNGLALIQK